MAKIENSMTAGFLARVTFKEEVAGDYCFDGTHVTEMLYTEDEDVYELIDFIEDHKDYIKDVLVLLPNGDVIDAREMTTNAAED